MVRMETALDEDHGPVSQVENVEFAFESGVDGVDLSFSNEEALKIFSRRHQQERSSGPFTAQDLLEALAAKKISRTNLLSHIELNPVSNELSLEADRTNIRARFGYDVGKKPYVYPEEALYLLDTGKAEIFCNHLSLSVQRARSLLLVPQNRKEKTKSGMEKYCSHDEYMVYKALTRMGYCLYRYKPEAPPPPNHGNGSFEISEDADVDSVQMEDDDVIIEGEQKTGTQIEDENIVELEDVPGGASSANHRKTFKRKFEDSPSDESSDEMMEDFPPMQAQSSYLFNPAYEVTFQDEPSGYTVDEADSDVEIVDEVIFSHGGVEIQEIGHSVGCQEDTMGMSDEPVPSTSRGPAPSEVVVDLVSSEDEDEDSKAFGRKVWSKFIPNSKVFFQKPPSKLIPQSIPSSDNVYEFDLKDKSDISDLELEFLVDEVSLNDDKYEWFPDSSESCNFTAVKSWKDWRQNIFQEARNVMNNSLLASSEYINGEAATEKLFLWEEFHEDSGPPGLILSKIVFAMYGPAVQGYSRQKALEGKPLYYVIISRQDDSIPDFGMFGSSINGVPVLIAVVCDSGEGEVVFMTTDRSPLNSLF